MNESFNPHWIGDQCVRDYRIGNVIVRDVPDDYVIHNTKFSRYETLLRAGHVTEFVESTQIETILLQMHQQVTAELASLRTRLAAVEKERDAYKALADELYQRATSVEEDIGDYVDWFITDWSERLYVVGKCEQQAQAGETQ